jgi:hypothetical protein
MLCLFTPTYSCLVVNNTVGKVGNSAKLLYPPSTAFLLKIKVAADGIAQMSLGRIDHETTANIGVIEGGE